MMAPALERAIYQAELAVCAANQSGIATGTITYASSFKRHYPYRAYVDDNAMGSVEHRQLTVPGNRWNSGQPEGYDDRPAVRPFVAIKTFNCPMTADLDLDISDSFDTYVYGSFMRFAGWRYINTHLTQGRDTTSPLTPGTPRKGMMKLGDRWDIGDIPSRVMGGDHYRAVFVFGTGVESAHPDNTELLSLYAFQDQPLDEINRAQRGDPDANHTLSQWYRFPGDDVDGVDVQYHYDDGSVERFNNLYHELRPAFRKRIDERPRWVAGWIDSISGFAGMLVVPRGR
jgi:hypothetical protein